MFAANLLAADTSLSYRIWNTRRVLPGRMPSGGPHRNSGGRPFYLVCMSGPNTSSTQS
jgi:hypothetical protein